MAKFYVKCDFSEVLKKLERMEAKMQSDFKEKALKEAGEFLKNRIKATVPVDTGKLQEAIDYRFKGDIIQVGVDHKTDPRTFIYSVCQEYGTHKMSKCVAPSYRNVC